ncbi:hypothetical protein XthCFBP4691_20110 [Xanthomonas theicola]|uniref:Uncharacterized protein n=1 Tax=Xanthomonas theicola TaxID=56464 RepID=A0A2S6YZS0_9XANT|nr:hypothetical protein XthCFBP4691_20110 [Xanthomonas theicola]
MVMELRQFQQAEKYFSIMRETPSRREQVGSAPTMGFSCLTEMETELLMVDQSFSEITLREPSLRLVKLPRCPQA